ncbi:hypothetical protein [Luteimonas terrae]|uniref:Uncharacterized protein n=1 Tax=Luteimonas terrae TaxID=1530191 RepID=A0ABU1XXG5_9GAMM|nr:hypothetical protein [Luteimonas terrae]MDR7193388.1 hypothetical protein [Luteimonas terrae]
MHMTEMQRIAMARAQVGDWDLADAMELLHRARHDHPVHRGYRTCLLSGERLGGRLAALNFGERDDVDELDDGEADERVLQLDLNGQLLWRMGDDDESREVCGRVIDLEWAQQIVDSYHTHVATKPVTQQPLNLQMETV